MRICLVGDCGIDQYLQGPNEIFRRPGGCTLNVAANLAALAPLGTDIHVVSALGEDANAGIVEATLAALPVHSHIVHMPGPTPIQRVEVDRQGERHFRGYEAGVLESFEMSPEQLRTIREADIVFTVVYEQIERLFTNVLSLNLRRLVVDFMDMGDFGKDIGRIGPWLAQIELAFFGLKTTDLDLLEGLRQRAQSLKKTFVATLGEAGATVFHGSEAAHVAAVPVAKVVDTTGAGDAFAAAFLSRYLRNFDLSETLAFAAHHAALVVQKVGAF